MSTKTPNIGLVKPARGEFQNTWDVPLNANLDLIDEKVGENLAEVTAARGSAGSLDERLDESLNADGTLKDPPEVTAARNSTIYGNVDGSSQSYSLDSRIEQADREIFTARQGAASLNDSLAHLSDDDVANTVITAPVNYLTFTGAVVTCDGSVTPVVSNINGYRQVVRTQKTTTVSGGAGTYYLYLQRSPTGDLYLDRTGLGQNTGQVSIHTGTGFLQKLTDSTQNFVTSGVQPGDLLEITSVGSLNKDRYVVASVLSATEIIIIGLFVTAQSNLNYKITNPLAPSLGFTATPHAAVFTSVTNKIFVGRCVFDGTNVTSVTIYALKGKYEQFTSITLTGGDFAQTLLHNLGYSPRKVEFFGSQASNYSTPLNPLANSDVTGEQRGVISDMTDLQIRVKNATNGLFYKDYDGTSQVAGFLLVRAER